MNVVLTLGNYCEKSDVIGDDVTRLPAVVAQAN